MRVVLDCFVCCECKHVVLEIIVMWASTQGLCCPDTSMVVVRRLISSCLFVHSFGGVLVVGWLVGGAVVGVTPFWGGGYLCWVGRAVAGVSPISHCLKGFGCVLTCTHLYLVVY